MQEPNEAMDTEETPAEMDMVGQLTPEERDALRELAVQQTALHRHRNQLRIAEEQVMLAVAQVWATIIASRKWDNRVAYHTELLTGEVYQVRGQPVSPNAVDPNAVLIKKLSESWKERFRLLDTGSPCPDISDAGDVDKVVTEMRSRANERVKEETPGGVRL